MFKSGDLIDGKYRVLSQVGSGGMGHVYRVKHIHLKSIRCIKVLKPTLAADATFRQRFVREAIVATRVTHGSVASVFDFAELPDGTLYMVSEFVEGLSARQLLQRLGPIPVPVAAGLAVEVLDGLNACHSKGILHRDVSPDNIMLTLGEAGELRARIIDLGIAKISHGKTGDLTQTGLYLGNPRYSSPEQLGSLDDDEEIDGRTDVYSLGVVLCEMVTGARPFNASTPQGYAAKHLTEPPPPLSKLNPELTFAEAFEKVVEKALEKNRANRWLSALEFSDQLKEFAGDWAKHSYTSAAIELISDVAAARKAQQPKTQPGTIEVPSIEQTETQKFEEPAPTISMEAATEPRQDAVSRWKFGLLLAAIVAVSLAIMIVKRPWTSAPSTQENPASVEADSASELNTPATPRLLIESFPTAILSEIRSTDAQPIEWEKTSTPAWVDLEPGDYIVVLENESLGIRKEFTIVASPSSRNPIRLVLAAPTADEYFAETGW